MNQTGLNTGPANRRVLVVLCGDLARRKPGLDLERIRRWFAENYPAVAVQTQPGLCQRPADLAELVVGEEATGIVLGLCDIDYPEAEVQTQLRKAGLDPLAAEPVPLGSFCAGSDGGAGATEKAQILLAAAVAKVVAFPSGGPKATRPHIPAKVSRRSLVRPLPLAYRPVPVVEEAKCAARAGCSLCLEACPYGALGLAGGRVALEKLRCEGCGICVTTCPTEAISLSSHSQPALAAQLGTLLDQTVGNIRPRSIIYTCPKARMPARLAKAPAWLPVTLPCTGMVVPTWLLMPLTMGAAAVRVLPCEGCRARGFVQGRVDFCRQLLGRVGLSPDLVGIDLPDGHIEPEVSPSELPAAGDLSLSHRPEVLAELARRLTPADFQFAHPWSPLGVVDVRPEACTGCGMCAGVCPTGALAFESSEHGVSLSFEPARCAGCGLCLRVCPELRNGAIAVERAVDLGRLRRGRVTLYRASVTRCTRCGAPVAPDALLNRVLTLLGNEYSSLAPVLTRYCNWCRGLVGPLDGRS